ncbi:XdhC family protein [Neobacillus drentensis]|uniref:XdhC family protein n=1 Tax=Neobacillus drentensis TaxID=220684 RepID=UPI003002EE36
MDDIYPILEVIDQPGKQVLATVIRVEGSAYKREGSSMLFLEYGKQIGMLAGGAVEKEVAIEAKDVFKKQEAKILHFNMSEENNPRWRKGSGFNGTIDILLEPVSEKLKEDFFVVRKSLERCKPVIMLKKLDDLGEYLFIEEEGDPFGNWSGPIPKIAFTSKSGIMTGPHSIYQHTYEPKPRLIIFGAGPDAIPLVHLASISGFSVTIGDWREEFCQKKNFPYADRILIGYPEKLLRNIAFSPYDYVVIMTHHFERDKELLKVIEKEHIRYLGVLGPQERTKRLLERETIPNWIHSPVGKSIGAKGPEEIAISIVAQLIEVRRKPVHEKMELIWTIPD